MEKRRVLSRQQLTILKMLYRFRFATAQLLTTCLDARSSTPIRRGLSSLVANGYIGRQYEQSYRLLGKPAYFYLLPKGITALRLAFGDACDSGALHSLYKDRAASSHFVSHSLSIFRIACYFGKAYGSSLQFFTKNELREFTYFPDPLPDAYVRLDPKADDKQFFLTYVDPLDRIALLIDDYLAYFETSAWDATDSPFPSVLLVAATASLEWQMHKWLAHRLENWYEGSPLFYTTELCNLEGLAHGEDGEIWRAADKKRKLCTSTVLAALP